MSNLRSREPRAPWFLLSIIIGSLLLFSTIVKNSMEERTFAIIKPDAVQAGNSGKIIDLIELNDFSIIRMEKITLSKEQAQKFYDIHKDKPFFGELVNFITSGPSIIMVLEKENAVKEWRELMGATNPVKAAPGTLRRMFGTNIGENATHGSDASETAQQEIGLFYPDLK